MRCKQILCIYNVDLECIGSQPKIKSLGMCDDCVLLELDEAFREKEKKRQRMDLEKQMEAEREEKDSLLIDRQGSWINLC